MAVKEISVAQLASLDIRGLYIVDVRETDEYESGHLPGAVSLPLSVFADRISNLPQDITVYMVCQSGGRSMRACEFCVDNGITNVVNVSGGTAGWIAGQHDVVFGAERL